MRRLFTTADALADGLTASGLRWGEARGRWRRVRHGVYAEGPEEVDRVDAARAMVLATDGIACGGLAGVLHGLDGVAVDGRPLRRRTLPADRVLEAAGLRCLGQARAPGTARIRRVLELRPPVRLLTGSLLETLMIQLVRPVPGVGEPVRQLRIGSMFLDQSWPYIGMFFELDGEQHLGQPVYDARRETAIVAATGWLCGRFTWTEVTRVPCSTARRASAIAAQDATAHS